MQLTTQPVISPLGKLPFGASLGGRVVHYRSHQSIYKQGTAASTLFYIDKGGVRLSRRERHRRTSATAILGAHDFFGELCLAGYPRRVSTAVALMASSIRTIKREEMLRLLRTKNSVSNKLVIYLLSSIKDYQDHVAHLLTATAEQRLARVLLRLAHLNKGGPPSAVIPHLSHQVLSEMVGTTRPRISFFISRFRKLGCIGREGGASSAICVRQSLRKLVGQPQRALRAR